jgi:hypothetical protein
MQTDCCSSPWRTTMEAEAHAKVKDVIASKASVSDWIRALKQARNYKYIQRLKGRSLIVERVSHT